MVHYFQLRLLAGDALRKVRDRMHAGHAFPDGK
jgi:hypothetical protein